MANFVCGRCGYDASTKAHLVRHLQSINPCNTNVSKIAREDIIKTLQNVEKKGETMPCEWCKKYITKSNYSRHKGVCTSRPSTSSQPVNQDNTPIAPHIIIDKDAFNQMKEAVKNEILNALVTSNNLSPTQPPVENNYDFTQEKFFQKVLESIYGGSHMKFDGGESDITTNEAHIEIKRWTCWKEIEGQLSAYNYFSKRDKLIACCFGPYQDYNKNIAYQVLTSKSIEVFDCQFCEKTNMFTYLNMTTNEKREILIMNV